MDISSSVGEEVCCSSKKARISYESRDFISNLPDDILVHILSFLPIQEALKTVLLRRFGNLWRGIQVLDFDSNLYRNFEEFEYDCMSDYYNENFVGLVRHVLNLHDCRVLDKLRLKFEFFKENGCDFQLEWGKSISDLLEKLIRFAMRRNVKVLDLNLRAGAQLYLAELYDLPDVLSSNYLTDLKLAAFNIKFCTTINLKLLKVLSLSKVWLNDEIMEKFLVGCPCLEDLSLIDCYGLRKLVCENPNLKKLMLTLGAFENELLVFSIWNFINVRCPSFEWKDLHLEIYLTKWHHPGLSLLLRKSPCLETLTINISSCSGGYNMFKEPEAIWIEAHEFDVDKYWDLQEATLPCLGTIMIYGSVNDPHVMEMVKFLLRSAIRLQKLVISTQEPSREERVFTSEQLQELSVKYKSLPKASPEAMIYFS